MRILYFDIDTLRADHLGCYGYLRATSPNIDRIAAEGVRFANCYVSDAPCLPSRASMFTGRFGIHTGLINHGGRCADPWPLGRDRAFSTMRQRGGLIRQFRECGLYPASCSPFAERHSAWWFCEGWREMHNSGRGGSESAEEIMPTALDWITRNARKDDWLLHINIWDTHTPYRAPRAFGNPFEGAPLEDWYTEDLRRAQWDGFGPGTPQEPAGAYGAASHHPRQPSQIASMDDYRRWVDGYDCGTRYADDWFGRTLNALADAGVLDDTVIVVTSDHGENLGELGVIGDHSVADHITSRVPMIVRWPGLPAGRVARALHYQTDVGATLVELAGGETPDPWDGRSFAPAFRKGEDEGRDHVVVSQGVWSLMRGVRWDDTLYLRVRHTGLKNLPERMLFNVRQDPHELEDLASSETALVQRGQALLDEWQDEMLSRSDCGRDPMDIIMDEGGPYHTRDHLDAYCARLRATGRAHHAAFLEQHPTGIA